MATLDRYFARRRARGLAFARRRGLDLAGGEHAPPLARRTHADPPSDTAACTRQPATTDGGKELGALNAADEAAHTAAATPSSSQLPTTTAGGLPVAEGTGEAAAYAPISPHKNIPG